MSTYILLRNNLESKALSLEELRATGLSPSDLVWVECQSWDWQRADEIPELKLILSGNEAIPSKKKDAPIGNGGSNRSFLPGDKKSKAPLKVKYTVLPEEAPIFPVEKSSEKPLVIPTKETLLEEKEIPAPETGIPVIPTGKKTVPIIEEPVVKIKPLSVPPPEKIYSSEPPDENMYKYGGIAEKEKKQEKETPALTTNYSRSLDEIKEEYVKNMMEKDRSRNKKTGWLPKEYRKIAVYVGFAAVGALLVLLIGRGSSNKKAVTASTQQQAVHKNMDADPVTAAVETTPVQQPVEDYKAANDDAPVSIAEEKKPVESSKTEVSDKKNTGSNEEKVIPKEDKPVVEETVEKKMIPTAAITPLVSVKANEYTTGSFGGIRNLEMTLQNDSKYTLDMVAVELKYLNLDNITVHTEIIHFRSVEPGQPSTIAVKKSRRGMKVVYKIIKIESKEAGNSIAGS